MEMEPGTTEFECGNRSCSGNDVQTDRNLLLQKFEELQQQHQQSLRNMNTNSTTSAQSDSNSNGNSEDFEDIQFFHRLPQLQPINMNMNMNGGDVIHGGLYDFNNTSENPFVFPDNVMEYGEPQFFPGNCVGYLETILEETDEEYEEEAEGCSGRHWWTADSDTDTDSVIRVDRVTSNNLKEVNQCQIPTTTLEDLHNLPDNTSLSNNSIRHLRDASFRTTASSKPFEMEDLYLFDQLDLAFEETLTKPRARTGFAFGDNESHQKLLLPLPLPLHHHHPTVSSKSSEQNEKTVGQISEGPISNQQLQEMQEINGDPLESAHSSDNDEPAEVNEEDFFYSTSEENSDLTETTTSESEDSSSDEGGNKDGVVLAEFSLQSGFNSGLFKSHRRSFEETSAKSNLRSFRSFDSLNSLAGTELLFSKADTFPSFHEFIKDQVDPTLSNNATGDEIENARNVEVNKNEVTRKSSGEMSSENLSEDSGICDGVGSASSGGRLHLEGQINCAPPVVTNYLTKSVFAINPLLYSSPSASEESSMVSFTSNQSFEPHNRQNSDSTESSPRSSPDSHSNSNNQCPEHKHSSMPNSDSTFQTYPQFRSTNGSSVELLLSNANNTTGTQVSPSGSGLHPSGSSSSAISYLEQTFACAKTPYKYGTHAITNPNPIMEQQHHQLQLQQRPVLTSFLQLHSHSQNLDPHQDFYSEQERSRGVGVFPYNDDDEDEEFSDAMFSMLEAQAQGEDENEDSSNSISTAITRAFSDLTSNVANPELIEMTSSSDNSAAVEVCLSGFGNDDSLRNANTEDESKSELVKQCLLQNVSHHINKVYDGNFKDEKVAANANRDDQKIGVAAGIIKSGPMSTLEELPSKQAQVQHSHSHSHSISPLPTNTTCTSPVLVLPTTVSVTISVVSMNSHISNPNTTTNCSEDSRTTAANASDMDYFESLESEILTEASEIADKYEGKPDAALPVPSVLTQSQNEKEHVRSVKTKKSKSATSTRPTLATHSVSVSEEEFDHHHLHLFDESSSRKAKAGEFTPTPIPRPGTISGVTNFGNVRNVNVRNDDAGFGDDVLDGVEARTRVPVSEPEVIRRRTWNCAAGAGGDGDSSNLDSEGFELTGATATTDVPDILKIRNREIKNTHNINAKLDKYGTGHVEVQPIMEIAERPRSISPRAPPVGIMRGNSNSSNNNSGSESPSPVPIKTYGSRGEVEVYLVSSRTPSPITPTMKIPGVTNAESVPGASAGGAAGSAGTLGAGESGSLKINKTVHFSPVVSEISWRESYTDQGSEFSESSNENLLDHYQYGIGGQDDEDENDDTDTINEDEMIMNVNKREVIERVQIQSQVIQEPLTSSIHSSGGNTNADNSNQSNSNSKPSNLSMVPDLLSQCENVTFPGENRTRTHIEVKIDEKSPSDGIDFIDQSEIEEPQQQQIFPAMFADTKETKSSKSSKTKRGFSIGKSKDKDKEKDKEKDKGKNKEKEINNEEIYRKQQQQLQEKEKPSFFQRLSKIRLSGGSGNKSKKAVKIHPKEKENSEPMIISKDEVDKKAGPNPGTVTLTAAPVLKKNQQQPSNNANSADNSTIFYNKNGHINSQIHEGEECSAAFESILEEIAGLNTIRQRQARLTATGNGTATSDSNKRTFAERNQFLSNPEIDRSRDRDSDVLESKLSQFKAEASKTRDEIAKSHPDLETIEDVTRTRTNQHQNQYQPKAISSPTLSSGDSPQTPNSPNRSPNVNEEQQAGSERKREREWYKLLKSAAEKYYYGGKVSKMPTAESATGTESGTEIDGDAGNSLSRDEPEMRSTGIVETDLDTGASREMLDAELVDLEKPSGLPPRPPLPKSPTGNGKARSLTNLTSGGLKFSLPPDPSSPLLNHHQYNHQGVSNEDMVDIDTLANEVEERAKSFEFLLDEAHKSQSVPPENQLRLETRKLSEHELRIQRSLQKLNVPDWYRKHGHADNQTNTIPRTERSTESNSSTTAALKLLKRSDYGSANGLAGGWAGLSAYRTPSLSSLQNSGRYTGSLTRSNFVRGRPATMSAMRSSRESLLSPSSTASQSPSAFERCSFTYGMPYSLSRFGHGRLSSTSGASPANSSPPATPGPLSASYTRKPYLGWRSQERLNASAGTSGPPKLSFYRPPAERLAAEVMTLRQKSTTLRPTYSDRPPLPRPPSRAEKTTLTRREHENSLPPSVHDSIREVTDAINQFVALDQEERPRPVPRQKSGRKQTVWMESSFVGRKPRATN